MIPLPLEKGGREGFWQKQVFKFKKRRNNMEKRKMVLGMVVGLFCLMFVVASARGSSHRDQIGSRGSRGHMYFQEGGSGSDV